MLHSAFYTCTNMQPISRSWKRSKNQKLILTNHETMFPPVLVLLPLSHDFLSRQIRFTLLNQNILGERHSINRNVSKRLDLYSDKWKLNSVELITHLIWFVVISDIIGHKQSLMRMD